MQNEFEKKVQQRLYDFELTPDAAVWNTVERRITKDKKRRRGIILWWSLGVLLLGGAGVWLATNNTHLTTGKPITKVEEQHFPNHKNSSSKEENAPGEGSTMSKADNPATSNKTPVKKEGSKFLSGENSKAGAVLKEGSQTTGNSVAAITGKATENSSVTTVKPAKTVGSSTQRTNTKKTRAIVSVDDQNTRDHTDKESQAKDNKNSSNSSGNSKKISDNLSGTNNTINIQHEAKKPEPITLNSRPTTEHSPSNADAIAKQETKLATSTEQTIELKNTAEIEPANLSFPVKTDSSQPASTAPSLPVAIAKPTAKKIAFELVLHAGLSDNIAGLGSKNKKSALTQDSNSPTSGGVTNAAPTIALNHQSAFSAGFEFNVVKQASPRWQIGAGLAYHYLSTRSAAGTRINASRNVFDSITGNSVSLEQFYSSPGSSSFSSPEAFVNRYHMLQVPLFARYSISKRMPEKLVITAGIYPGFLVGSNALYYNRRDRISYVDKKQFNDFQLGVGGGFLYHVFQSKTIGVKVGPQVRYTLTNLSKSIYNNRQHLVYAGVATHIQFNRR